MSAAVSNYYFVESELLEEKKTNESGPEGACPSSRLMVGKEFKRCLVSCLISMW